MEQPTETGPATAVLQWIETISLGIELLAADIIRTVALQPTLQSIAVLGLLVLIPTFLSWSLVVEIEGRWPWQARPGEAPGEITGEM